MKKLLLVITLLFVYTIESYAQSIDATVFSAKMAQLDTYKNQWVWSDAYDVDIDIKITNTKMYVYDKNHSVYTFTTSSTTINNYNNKVISYRAIDEEGKRCKIELVSWIDKTLAIQLYVVYSDIRYAYSLTSK